jgi:hypothetical protein
MFGETDSYTSVIKYSVLNLQNLYGGKCLQNAESTEVFKEKKNIYIYIFLQSVAIINQARISYSCRT